MAGPHHAGDLVVEQRREAEACRRHRPVADDEVDLAAFERGHELVLLRHPEEIDGDVGRGLADQLDHARQEEEAEAIAGHHLDRAVGGRGLEVVARVEHAVEIVEDAIERGEQLGAAVGRDEMGAAPDKERIAGDVAELPERKADRRLALPGAGRRPRDARLAQDDLTEPHQPEIERTILCRDLHGHFRLLGGGVARIAAAAASPPARRASIEHAKSPPCARPQCAASPGRPLDSPRREAVC